MTRRMRFVVPWTMRAAAAAAVGLVAANGASAFFFKGWPGDGLPRERSLLPPSTQTNQPPGETEWPPYRPPTDQPPPEEHPKPTPPGVPEPATGLLAAFGVGVAAIARRRKRRKG
jgi:PEP-CTERM motif-containing protein